METFSALLAICGGNSPVPGEFPTQRPVMRSFDVFFDLRLNKWLSKQSWGWWFEMQYRLLWCHFNESPWWWIIYKLDNCLVYVSHSGYCSIVFMHFIWMRLVKFYPDSIVHGANMGPIWGRQDPGGPHVGPMNFAIWVIFSMTTLSYISWMIDNCGDQSLCWVKWMNYYKSG